MTWFSLFVWLFGLVATPSVRSLYSWLCSGKSLLMVEGNHVRCRDRTQVVHVKDWLPSCCAISLSSFLGRPVVLGKLPGKPAWVELYSSMPQFPFGGKKLGEWK